MYLLYVISEMQSLIMKSDYLAQNDTSSERVLNIRSPLKKAYSLAMDAKGRYTKDECETAMFVHSGGAKGCNALGHRYRA